MYNIRPAQSGDISEIFALMHCSICTLCKEHYSAAKLESYLNLYPGDEAFKQLMRDQISIVALNNKSSEIKQLVGFARFDPTEVAIAGLFVQPEYSRQGIGSCLLSYIEDIARSLSKEMLSVKAPLNAISFYESHGYIQQKNVHIDCEDNNRIECVSFIKRLS